MHPPANGDGNKQLKKKNKKTISLIKEIEPSALHFKKKAKHWTLLDSFNEDTGQVDFVFM